MSEVSIQATEHSLPCWPKICIGRAGHVMSLLRRTWMRVGEGAYIVSEGRQIPLDKGCAVGVVDVHARHVHLRVLPPDVEPDDGRPLANYM